GDGPRLGDFLGSFHLAGQGREFRFQRLLDAVDFTAGIAPVFFAPEQMGFQLPEYPRRGAIALRGPPFIAVVLPAFAHQPRILDRWHPWVGATFLDLLG